MTETTSPKEKKTKITVQPKKQLVKIKSFKDHALENEIEITGFLLSAVLIGYYYLDNSSAKKCLFLSYQVKEGIDQYDKGLDDIYFIGFWIIAFTFLRAATMKYIFHPTARLSGINPHEKRTRFAEQAWFCSCYAVFWSCGMYIMYHSPHWFNTSQYWIDYPHILISKKMKTYYLMQLAFWFHQIYTLHAEKKRKDHIAMLSHHFITVSLLVSSYYTNFTRIGNAVLCCMDLSDIFLSLAKILKYIGLSLTCDITFGLFAFSWPITRHIFFSMIIWATAVQPSQYIDMKWDPSKGKFFTPFTQKIYIIFFLALNLLMVYWFAMIVRVIVRVWQGKSAEDSRSDDEDYDDEQEKEKEVVVKTTLAEKNENEN